MDKRDKIFAALAAFGYFAIVAFFYAGKVDAQNPLSRRVTPISTELAYTAITATGPSAATTLYTLTEDCGILSFENTTNQEIDVLMGPSGGAQVKKRVPAQSFRVYDLVTNYTRWSSGTVLKVFAPTAPTGPSNAVFEVLCNPQ